MRSNFLFVIATFLGGCGSFSGQVAQVDPAPPAETPVPPPTPTATSPETQPPPVVEVKPEPLDVRLKNACASAKAMLVDGIRYDNVLHPVNQSTLDAYLPGKWFACPSQSAVPIFDDSGIVLHEDRTSAALSYDMKTMTITEQGIEPPWALEGTPDGWFLGGQRFVTVISTDKKQAVMAKDGLSVEGIFVKVD